MSEPSQTAEVPQRSESKEELNNMLLEKWIDISIETDRQLLTLSTGGIGLIAAFITTKGVGSFGQMSLLILACLFFLVTLTCTFFILHLNKKHIACVMAGESSSNSLLGFLDRASVISFSIGVILATMFAFNVANTDLEQKSKESTSKTEQKNERSEQNSERDPSGHACRCCVCERESQQYSQYPRRSWEPSHQPAGKQSTSATPKPAQNRSRCTRTTD